MLLNRSWGARGHPFTQHYSCPAVLRCYIGSLVAAFSGYRFVCDKVLPQSPSPEGCAQSARRQRPCCRQFIALCFFFKCVCSIFAASFQSLWSRVSTLPPFLPRRALIADSSSSRSRPVISLCPLRGHLILSRTASSDLCYQD